MQKRELWADYVKAFAIFLMVWCHAGLNIEWLCDFIYLFHMPAFFLISGYFDKGKRLDKETIKKTTLSLFCPYFFFSFCDFAVCWISPYLHPELYYGMSSMPQIFKAAFCGMLLMEDMVRPFAFLPGLALWFLPALFFVKFFFSVIHVFFRYSKFLAALFLIFIIVVAKFVDCDTNYFSLHSACLALPFYIVGFIFRKFCFLEFIRKRQWQFLLAFFLWIYMFFGGMKNIGIDIDGCKFGQSMLLFYLNGTIGTLACIFSFKAFKACFADFPLLARIGASTITILGIHPFFCVVGRFLIVSCNPSAYVIPILTMAVAFASCYVGLYVHSFLRNRFPLALGIKADNR